MVGTRTHLEDNSSESSTEEENKDSKDFNNPLERRKHDSKKLQEQQKEILKLVQNDETLRSAHTAQIKKNHEQFMNKQTRPYATVSLCGLTVQNPFRARIIQIVYNPWFDRIILTTILANSIVLAAETPGAAKNTFLETLDYIFLTIFSIEMILKIIALGFVMLPYSYLRDPWNLLDFSVVILGWLGLFDLGGGSNVNSIRVVRILRPLRTINSVPGMRGLVGSLLRSLPQMFNILILLIFTLVIFGTIGIQLFQGSFKGRCVLESSVSEASGFTGVELLSNRDGSEFFCQLGPNPPFQCPEGYQCVNFGNPEQGLSHYDNIFVALITSFEMITLEGWTGIMYQIRLSRGGFSLEGDIFCVACVVFGALFVLNLMIAVQFKNLDESFTEIEEQKAKEAALLQKQMEELSPGQAALGQSQSGVNTAQQKTEQQEQEEGEGSGLGSEEETDKKKDSRCCGCWVKFQEKMNFIVTHKRMTYVVVTLILLNSVLMASEMYDQSETLGDIQYYGNVVFTILFTIEMLMSMIGLGLKGYFSDGFYCFDCVVVILSLVELGAQIITQSKEGGMFSILRGFRLLRIFKLVKSWTSLQNILATVITSLPSVANLAVLAMLFLFIYALIGKQFFYGELIDPDTGVGSRYHFKNFWRSLITMFIVLTGENWNWVMRIVIENRPDQYYTAVIFFISAILVGNFMLLNLFLAILLKNLQDHVMREAEAKAAKRDQETNERLFAEQAENGFEEAMLASTSAGRGGRGLQATINLATTKAKSGTLDRQQAKAIQKLDYETKRKILERRERRKKAQEEEAIADAILNNKAFSLKTGVVNTNENAPQRAITEKLEEEEEEAEKSGEESNGQEKHAEAGGQKRLADLKQSQIGKSVGTSTMMSRKKRPNAIELEGNSLGCIRADNPLRIKIAEFVQNPYFEAFVLHLIGLNSLLMALEEPILKDEYAKATLKLFGDVISAMFIVECVLKIFVMGFIRGKKAYLKEPFNVLDFVIVVISIAAWVLESMDGFDISFVRAFRALRALRPLKLVSKNEGMKLVVNSILGSIPSLINVGLISALFYFVFGVIGLQMLMGKVSYCADADGEGLPLNKEECLALGNEWTVPPNNYDNIFMSMVTFFEISTLEMWPDIMFSALDSAKEVDGVMEEDNHEFYAVLYLGFIFITTFFVMNLFISVIVRQFSEQKIKTEGVAGLTDEQKEWVKIQRHMVDWSPVKVLRAPDNKCRKFVYSLVVSRFFDGLITLVIILNTITMCMEFYGAGEFYLKFLHTCNLIFVVVFTLEAILKLIGLGPSYYFWEDWNKFDFAIVVVSLVSESPFFGDVNLTAFRIIRVARLLRMIKASKHLQDLLRTLYLALNNIANVGVLFMLLIFVFSVAGMDLFGQIETGSVQGPDGGGIDANCNFNTFYMAVFVLIRAATGESWNAIMHDTVAETAVLSYIFWMGFQLVTFFIFMNVFIAVIYEEYSKVNQDDTAVDVLSLKVREIILFVDTWGLFCPDGSPYMDSEKFKDFLLKLPPPLGYFSTPLAQRNEKGEWIDPEKKRHFRKIMYCLASRIKDHNGKMYFPEVMWAIFYSIIGKNNRYLNNCKPMKAIMRRVKNKYPHLKKETSLETLCGNKIDRNHMTVAKLLIGNLILNQWKEKKARLNRGSAEQSKLQTIGRKKSDPCEKLRNLVQAVSCKELLEFEKHQKELEDKKVRARGGLASPLSEREGYGKVMPDTGARLVENQMSEPMSSERYKSGSIRPSNVGTPERGNDKKKSELSVSQVQRALEDLEERKEESKTVNHAINEGSSEEIEDPSFPNDNSNSKNQPR